MKEFKTTQEVEKDETKLIKLVDNKLQFLKDICDSDKFTKDQFVSLVQLFITLYYGNESR